jgi:chromosomal replication initiator protein
VHKLTIRVDVDNLWITFMNHLDFWNKTKDELKKRLPAHTFDTWLEPIEALEFGVAGAVLQVPNQFFSEWVDTHYSKHILNTINDMGVKTKNLKLVVSGEAFKAEETENNNSAIVAKNQNRPRHLSSSYSFERFIEGPNNQFAKAAAQKVSDSPGSQAFNPLVIYGGVGLGKTHLLHAIGNEIIETSPKTKVVIASSEKFTLDFISSIQKNNTAEFSKSYRKADVLLIDDIQFFQKKEQTQEQFFHTFNELYQLGKQIVMTADRYPGEMSGLQDRLLSRFQSGLSVDVQPPNYETRVAILMEKSEINGLDLPYNMIEFIAMHLKNSVRELESTIIRLLAHASLSQVDIDFPLVKKVLKERLGDGISADISAEDIINRVADLTNIRSDDIVGPSRRKEIAEARQIAVYLCRELLGLSLSTIGMHFGGRDHTTALHACNKIRNALKSDKRFNRIVGKVKDDFSFAIL